MKKLFYSLLICLALTANTFAQDQIKIDEKTVIKDENGKKISLDKFSKLMSTAQWTIVSKSDADGDYLKLVKASAEQRAKMMEMMSKKGTSDPNIGKDAPDFTFTDVNGNVISKENTIGKVVVLNFWFTTCPPCIKEIPELNEVHEEYKSNEDVVFASISFEQQERVQRFLTKKPISYPVVANASAEISKFRVSGYPTNVIIGKDGKYKEFIVGGFSGVGEAISEGISKALAK